MAFTIDDFNKIWASTSPLTPYEFSESNYKEGWNFIGGTPPSRQMWDFLQKQNDEKLKYLLDNFDNYLPLSGGTMTGAIIGNPLTLTADDGNGNTSNLVLNSNGNATLDEKRVLGNPFGLNILPNGIFCSRQISVYNDRQLGKFTISEPTGTCGFSAIVSFSSPTNDAFNRTFICQGYWTGGSTRTRYAPLLVNTDGAYTVAIDPSSDTITFTVTSIGGIVGTATILAEYPEAPVTFTWTSA